MDRTEVEGRTTAGLIRSHRALITARVLVVFSRIEEGHGLVFQEQQQIVSPPGTFFVFEGKPGSSPRHDSPPRETRTPRQTPGAERMPHNSKTHHRGYQYLGKTSPPTNQRTPRLTLRSQGRPTKKKAFGVIHRLRRAFSYHATVAEPSVPLQPLIFSVLLRPALENAFQRLLGMRQAVCTTLLKPP